MVVLKNSELEISYILAELFTMFLKESCVTDCWKDSSALPLLKSPGKSVWLKTTVLLVFFVILSQIFGLISFFLRRLRVVLAGLSLHRNIQLMLEFLKAPFLVMQFYCYILMTFLMMLFVILLSVLMILLPTLNVIRLMICGTN